MKKILKYVNIIKKDMIIYNKQFKNRKLNKVINLDKILKMETKKNGFDCFTFYILQYMHMFELLLLLWNS
jgi:hypothetical protein